MAHWRPQDRAEVLVTLCNHEYRISNITPTPQTNLTWRYWIWCLNIDCCWVHLSEKVNGWGGYIVFAITYTSSSNFYFFFNNWEHVQMQYVLCGPVFHSLYWEETGREEVNFDDPSELSWWPVLRCCALMEDLTSYKCTAKGLQQLCLSSTPKGCNIWTCRYGTDDEHGLVVDFVVLD